MTREEAVKEIKKAFEPAFANYIITALTEGATVSDKEPTTKNGLGVDAISRKAALDITWHDPSYSDPLNVLTEVRDKIRELPSVTPHEQFKPMVEIDLYSVIKQKYIEREVLDKIRAEIEEQEKWLLQAGYNTYNVDIAFNSIKRALAESEG